jgi:hypothetical protein
LHCLEVLALIGKLSDDSMQIVALLDALCVSLLYLAARAELQLTSNEEGRKVAFVFYSCGRKTISALKLSSYRDGTAPVVSLGHCFCAHKQCDWPVSSGSALAMAMPTPNYERPLEKQRGLTGWLFVWSQSGSIFV